MSLASDACTRIGWLWRSSTLRLSLLLSGVFAIGMAGAILVALDLGRDAVEERLDASLRSLSQSTVLADWQGDGGQVILRAQSDLSGLPPGFGAALGRGGGMVELEDDFRFAETWRVLPARDAAGTPVLIAAPFDDSDDTFETLAGVLWATAGFVIVLTLVIGGIAGLLAQRRLLRINQTMGRLAAGDLTARTGLTRARDDLDDIAGQLDRTASDLERLVSQTRHLSASLAHDLRTPLARLRARLETLPEGDARAMALEEASRVSDIFDTILRVARIEAAQGAEGFERVEINPFINELAEIFGPVIEDAGKTLVVRKSGAGHVRADRQMLVQAMANLIQNALVHGGPEVTVFAADHEIGVADNGAGVPPDMRQEILRPMVRLDAARTRDGSGLGLALVRAVADRHGAALELSEQEPQGLRVSLNFTKK